MKILEQGDRHPLYQDSLGHLSHIQYNSAYAYVVELTKAKDKFNNGSVSLLEKFGKLESLPILEEMLQTPEISKSDERMVQDAIQSIKEKNNIHAQANKHESRGLAKSNQRRN